MTTKQLTARQARWAEALSEYYFIIMYRAGKSNGKADVLTHRDDEVRAQDRVKTKYRTCAFLSEDQIDPRVLQDLGIEINPLELALLEEDHLEESTSLVDQILQANRGASSLGALCTQATSVDTGGFSLEDRLLFYSSRLVIPRTRELITSLIQEAHTQVSTAHPGTEKTYYLLRPCYY
jgi:hypothetical protein